MDHNHLAYQNQNQNVNINHSQFPLGSNGGAGGGGVLGGIGGKQDLIGVFEAYKWPIIAFIFSVYIYRSYMIWSSLKHVPTMGASPGFLGYWGGMWAYLTRSQDLLLEGYAKYGPTGQAFKVATFRRHMILVTDPAHVDELRKARDDLLSFNQSAEDRMHFKWTMDRSIIEEPYHLDIVRKDLTQRLGSILPELMGEIEVGFNECAEIGDNWVPVNVVDLLVDVIARASNRMFVGVPLCRNKEYLNACIGNAIRVSTLGVMIDLLPGVLRPFFAWALLGRYGFVKTVKKHISPILQDRRRKMQELGDKWDKPNDALQWLLDQAPPGRLSTDEQLAIRVLILNFVAIHTSSISLMHIIYDLAADPSYIDPLREEIYSVLGPNPFENLTKQNLTSLRKLDSVLRESQRFNGLGMMTLTRKCLTDYTFTSGKQKIPLPQGSHVSAATSAIHKDSAIYGNPQEFDGFRFSREESNGNLGEKQFFAHQMFVTTSLEYLPFGHGKHACPGRFFASNELKLIMIHILLNYEFRLVKECEGKRPPNKSFYGIVRPAMGKLVEFKRRT